MEITERLRPYGLGCPKCVDGMLRRLHLCNDCKKIGCVHGKVIGDTLSLLTSGVSVLVIRCEGFSKS